MTSESRLTTKPTRFYSKGSGLVKIPTGVKFFVTGFFGLHLPFLTDVCRRFAFTRV